MHFFPSKWYLPQEPHIHILLLNWVWPACPRQWIRFWLFLRAVALPELVPYKASMLERYCEFCREDVVYLTNRRHRRLGESVFGNHQSLMDFYIEHGQGGFARLARRLPLRPISAWIGATFRMNMVFQQKAA